MNALPADNIIFHGLFATRGPDFPNGESTANAAVAYATGDPQFRHPEVSVMGTASTKFRS